MTCVGIGSSYPLFFALPYVLSLAALAGWFGRSRAPEGLARGEGVRSGYRGRLIVARTR